MFLKISFFSWDLPFKGCNFVIHPFRYFIISHVLHLLFTRHCCFTVVICSRVENAKYLLELHYCCCCMLLWNKSVFYNWLMLSNCETDMEHVWQNAQYAIDWLLCGSYTHCRLLLFLQSLFWRHAGNMLSLSVYDMLSFCLFFCEKYMSIAVSLYVLFMKMLNLVVYIVFPESHWQWSAVCTL